MKRLDKQVIKRKPNWATPVGVTAKQFRTRLSRVVLHAICNAIDRQHIGMSSMILAQRTNAVITQELSRVEHAFEKTFHPVTPHQGQETTFASLRSLPVRDQSHKIR